MTTGPALAAHSRRDLASHVLEASSLRDRGVGRAVLPLEALGVDLSCSSSSGGHLGPVTAAGLWVLRGQVLSLFLSCKDTKVLSCFALAASFAVVFWK